MSKESLNVGLSAYLDKVAESGALSVADSLWLRDTMKEKANADFLQDVYKRQAMYIPIMKATPKGNPESNGLSRSTLRE